MYEVILLPLYTFYLYLPLLMGEERWGSLGIYCKSQNKLLSIFAETWKRDFIGSAYAKSAGKNIPKRDNLQTSLTIIGFRFLIRNGI